MAAELTAAQMRYERAMRTIRTGLTARVGGTAAESEAASAFSAMVREGTASPIGRKYVTGVHRKQVRK